MLFPSLKVFFNLAIELLNGYLFGGDGDFCFFFCGD
jgi:hypothetical protein